MMTLHGIVLNVMRNEVHKNHQKLGKHSARSESVGGPSGAARGRQPQFRRAHGDGRKSLLRPLEDVAAATKRPTTSRLTVCGA